MIKQLYLKGCIFEGIKMKEHQKYYIKLLDEKFGVKGKPRRAYYEYYNTPDRGIIVELEPLPVTRVFISDEPRSYYHKWSSELNSMHLPDCVWLTSKSDSSLCLDKGFFI